MKDPAPKPDGCHPIGWFDSCVLYQHTGETFSILMNHQLVTVLLLYRVLIVDRQVVVLQMKM